MDGFMIVIMIVLFIIALLFVFSTALLTPYIGKKNLVSVILLGLVVGLVGGAFLLAPIIDDLPDFTRTVLEESVEGTDVVELELSTNNNLTEAVQNISSITGVEKLEYDGITFKIADEFYGPGYKNRFLSVLKSSNENISNVTEIDNETFYVNITEGGDPQNVLDAIYSTFSKENYIHLKYTSMTANATVKANNVTKIMQAITENNAIVTNVTGPTENTINLITSIIPSEDNVILVSGLMGVIVGLLGFFVDSVYNFIANFKGRKRKRKTSSKRDRIKQNTVPGGQHRKTIPGTKKVNPDSIDIFNDDFNNSPKQTVGSNRRFKQLDEFEEEQKSRMAKKEKSDKKSGGRFSNIFKRSSKDKSDETEVKEEKKVKSESKMSDKPKKAKRRVQKVRPKRKD